ncbi:MAG: VOC family protein [Brucellaceae bacterium]|nr:VOC family protein [Brucellaceae bacterium]
MTSPRQARRIDHCVLPVPDLETARVRLANLGFTVAPDGLHPFGTENACVYFADDTFLEPLAIAQRETAEAAALKGNVFVARDAAYRFRRGENGFSALVMATDDAAADDRQFKENGMSAGRMLRFSRKAADASGKSGTASFKLAFAADLRAPDAFFFTCERVAAPAIDRSALQRHDNGVTGIAAIVMSEPNPSDFQYLLQEVVNQRDVEAHSFGMDIETANATIHVLTSAGMQAHFGMKAASHARGLRLRGIVFTVDDLARCEDVLTRNGVEFARHLNRLVVAPADGQGAIFAFEETSK